MKEYRILVTGVVQGIGFRPSVYQIAKEHNIKGEIKNASDGVLMIIQTDQQTKECFVKEICSLKVPGIRIDKIEVTEENCFERYKEFQIKKSLSYDGMTEIPIDSAMCDECEKELMKIDSDRYLYPLVACTNCGPRITVIRRLPYDRKDTTMSYLKRCRKCERSYFSPYIARRFNFETDSCWNCGPWIGFIIPKTKQYIKLKSDFESAIEKKIIEEGYTCIEIFDSNGSGMKKLLQYMHERIKKGDVLAIKGVGGYQIIADATNNKSVETIRARKHRDKKPLAVMFSDLDMIREYCICTSNQERMLDSRIAPIVLMRQREKNGLAKSVTYNISDIGAMLPNSPIHKMVVDRPLVMTSANVAGVPLIYEDDIGQLEMLADGIFLHDRKIQMGLDDSLIKRSLYGNIILRYARGFAPNSFAMTSKSADIVAFGSDLKSSFTIVTNNRMILSQYIGDLEYENVQERFFDVLDKYINLYNPQFKFVIVDKHTEYHSRIMGQQFAKMTGCKLIAVQHHYAHALSVMAEHSLEGKYVCIILDGTGYGDDGKIWGGEIMLASRQNFERKVHFEYINLIGGERAIKQPYRQILSIKDRMNQIYETNYGMSFSSSNKGRVMFNSMLMSKYKKNLEKMYNDKVNCIETSSVGRLFDLVAAMVLGIEIYDYEGEAATLVEQFAQQYLYEKDDKMEDKDTFFLFDKSQKFAGFEDDAYCMIFGRDTYKSGIIKSIEIIAHTMYVYEKTDDAYYSCFMFHAILAFSIASCAYITYENTRADGCILSGGVYQNALLKDMTITLLRRWGIQNIHTNVNTSPNDGSISLGQAYFQIDK